MQVSQTQGIRHSEVLVRDIMTPRKRREVICIDDMKAAVVGDVVATQLTQGRQHALVADRHADRSQTLRGLFIASSSANNRACPSTPCPSPGPSPTTDRP